MSGMGASLEVLESLHRQGYIPSFEVSDAIEKPLKFPAPKSKPKGKNQGQNVMLLKFFDTGSTHIQLSKIGGDAVFGLVDERDQGVGIFPAGVDENSHDGTFFTVFAGDNMRERIEREMASCTPQNGKISRYYKVCERLSNAYLQTSRHEAGWYAGDLLTGAYKHGKDHELGGELKGTTGDVHFCVWTNQNGHEKPPHLCVAPHRAIPSGMNCSHYLGSDELFNGIQVGTCLKKIVAAVTTFGIESGDTLASQLAGLSFQARTPKFESGGDKPKRQFMDLIGPSVFGGGTTAKAALNPDQRRALSVDAGLFVLTFRPFKDLTSDDLESLRDELETAKDVWEKMKRYGPSDVADPTVLTSGGYAKGIQEAGGKKESAIRRAMANLSSAYDQLRGSTQKPGTHASSAKQLLNVAAGESVKLAEAPKRNKKRKQQGAEDEPSAEVAEPMDFELAARLFVTVGATFGGVVHANLEALEAVVAHYINDKSLTLAPFDERFEGRSLDIPWEKPILGVEGLLDFGTPDLPKNMGTAELRWHALNGPGPCDQMAILRADKTKLLSMIAENEKEHRAKRNHLVEASLIILGITKATPAHCPCGIRTCTEGKIWAVPEEPTGAQHPGAAQAISNPAQPIVLRPRPFHEMFLLPAATAMVVEGGEAAGSGARPTLAAPPADQ